MAFSENLIMAAANTAPRLVERLVRAAVCNQAVLGCTRAATRQTLGRVEKLERIAVVADTNIGDAVVLQGACAAFKRWLPKCAIDYFYQAKAEPLLRLNPHIDGHHPVFTDADFTSSNNRRAVQSAILRQRFDLILNLYPFLMNSELRAARCPVLVPYGLITGIVQAEKDPQAIAHVGHQLTCYVRQIAHQLSGTHDSPEAQDAPRNIIYLDADVPARAGDVLRRVGVDPRARLAFLNPDSSSRFSRIPLALQEELVKNLLDDEAFERVLIGPAYSFPEASDELCAAVADHPAHAKVVRLPQNIPIDTYAGLIDRAALFITPDTAQMHIAAGRRVASGTEHAFRNRTALLTIFGATNSRIYGYDSFAEGFLDSNQDAPAKVFEGAPRCKNLTCIHKTRKTCRTVECFTGLDMKRILAWIKNRDWTSTDKQFAPDKPGTELDGKQAPAVPACSRGSEPIIVVSGLPRSGTSLMMQMLAAGGVEVATDGIRKPDEDNPRGYFELERVKALDRDTLWLDDCPGKAVKIISMLLSSLPARHRYRIIFVERRLPEVLASQKRMQQRRGTLDPRESDEELTAAFRQHLLSTKQQLAKQPNIETLYVAYQALIESPRETAQEVCQFLRQQLEVEKMVCAVDTKLYRNKQAATPEQVSQSPAARAWRSKQSIAGTIGSRSNRGSQL